MLPKFTLTEIYDIAKGDLSNGRRVERRLSDLKGCFADEKAYEELLKKEDTLLYGVSAYEHASGPGDLHYGIGILYPGKVGEEYFMTKGHLHTWREAAEVYIGLKGKGVMLLEDEETGESRLEPLEGNSIVFVPGHTAHRTMNVGDEPLVYIGVYPAKAGHDYSTIAQNNFRMVVRDRNGQPEMVERSR